VRLLVCPHVWPSKLLNSGRSDWGAVPTAVIHGRLLLLLLLLQQQLLLVLWG
jgi:hypothetical protein